MYLLKNNYADLVKQINYFCYVRRSILPSYVLIFDITDKYMCVLCWYQIKVISQIYLQFPFIHYIYSFFKALSIAALYCRQSEHCFRHFASGLPPPIAHL